MNINYIAPLNTLGYGVVGLNLLYQIVKNSTLDDNISVFPMGNTQGIEKHNEKILKCINERYWYDKEAPSLRLWHQFALMYHIGNGRKIGFPIFELDKFTDIEIANLERLDNILVCSQWAKSIVDNNLEEKVPCSVVPLGVDRDIFNEDLSNPDENYFTFLNIGKWEYRKGHDVLAEAFTKAFTPKDNVRLIMMPDNPFIGDENNRWKTSYLSSSLSSKITFIPRVDTHQEVATIMGKADCGVFPTRSEGWNLELLEMMSMGKQVISTNYSGNTEFCNDKNCHLIDIREKEVANDGIFFSPDYGHTGRWARLDIKYVDDLVDRMRFVYNNRSRNDSGIETAKRFSWENSFKKLKFAIT